MDIKKIKYSRELMKAQSRLEKELKIINSEINHQQEKCDHIIVCFDNQFCCCLFCLKENPKSLYNVIDARRSESSNFTIVSEIDRAVILYEVQKEAINKLLETPSLSEEELVNYLNAIIKSPRNSQKIYKKN